MVEVETREFHHLLARRIIAIGAGVHCSALTSGISVDLDNGMTNASVCIRFLVAILRSYTYGVVSCLTCLTCGGHSFQKGIVIIGDCDAG
jgi:hypothetical protein